MYQVLWCAPQSWSPNFQGIDPDVLLFLVTVLLLGAQFIYLSPHACAIT
jgi:hypothetical protein